MISTNGPRPNRNNLPMLDINAECTKSEWVNHFFNVTDYYSRLTNWQDAEIQRLTMELQCRTLALCEKVLYPSNIVCSCGAIK